MRKSTSAILTAILRKLRKSLKAALTTILCGGYATFWVGVILLILLKILGKLFPALQEPSVFWWTLALCGMAIAFRVFWVQIKKPSS